MTRAVTADSILFQEAIECFRKEPPSFPFNTIKLETKQLKSYLLFDFYLGKEIKIDNFHIDPTVEISLAGAYKAFISEIQFDHEDFIHHNSHLYAIAASAILSFLLERPVKSIKDDYHTNSNNLEDHLSGYALQFPILTAGPGAVHRLSQKKFTQFLKDLTPIIQSLFDLEYKQYKRAMNAMRLVQLAHLNFRDDFALSLALLVAAIEAVAQYAIDKEDVSSPDAKVDEWSKLAQSDGTIKDILTAYKEIQGKDKLLKKRFVEFILKYCPLSTWKEMEHHDQYLVEMAPHSAWLTRQDWDESYPEDIEEAKMKDIIGDTYAYRSNFVHRGEQPPYQSPHPRGKYFEELLSFDAGNLSPQKIILINYQTLSFIARKSIFKYFIELSGVAYKID